MRLAIYLALVVLISACAAEAQHAPSQSDTDQPAELQEPAPLVMMNLAAHPDDEDGTTMAYYRHAKNAIVHSVVFTRGEGGQNEIGPELYEALGAIRSDETERAARHLGTQVHFLNFSDFGYSKIADEAFEKWGGRDYVTARLVYMIRKLKPDVLFTNHDTLTTGPNRQHGQHQAVGISAYDAFELAADPTYHPEQLEEAGVDLWQPKRLFLRHWRSSESDDVRVPVGNVMDAKGMSAAVLAANALGEHASQGMDMFAQRVQGIEEMGFELIRSATDAPLDSTDLAGNLPPNSDADPDLTYLIDSGRIPAVSADAFTLSDSVAVAGQRVRLNWDADQLPAPNLRLTFSGVMDTTLQIDPATPDVAMLEIPAAITPTVPRKVYQYEQFSNHPPVVYAAYAADSLVAAGYLPLAIAPAVYLEAGADVMRLHPGPNRIPVEAHVFDPAAQQLNLNMALSRDADRNVVLQEQTPLRFSEDGLARDTLTLNLPASLAAGDYTLTLTGLAQPTTAQPAPTRDHVTGRVFDVTAATGLNVGVIESYDNTLEQALQELGVAYVMLDSLALAEGSFDDLHTIVVDIRAYLIRNDLRTNNDKLLAWVNKGGHLIVNYQKTFEWNTNYPDPFDDSRNNPGNFAPYEIVLSHDRVTREEAEVDILLPDHPLLHQPNEIGAAAWDGWVQERGLYFPSSWDDAYDEVFCMHDPGEEPLCGSTLLASYGEGTYLYTALVWYRQLKVYHPGAYALFANMISLPLTDGRTAAMANEP